MSHLFRLVGLSTICIVLQSCAAYNTTSEGGDGKLMLKGYDPVAYHTLGKPAPGRPDVKVEQDGVTYRFMSEETRALFVKAPVKYIPQYGGFCANGIVYGIPWGGDPDTWKIMDGKLYIFGGEGSRRYFLMDEKQNRMLADQYWNEEVKNTTPLIQRYKRLIFRVPHYRTGAELEAEWRRRQETQGGK